MVSQAEATEGAYVYGLFLEGAKWELEDDAGNFVNPYKVDKTPCAGPVLSSLCRCPCS